MVCVSLSLKIVCARFNTLNTVCARFFSPNKTDKSVSTLAEQPQLHPYLLGGKSRPLPWPSSAAVRDEEGGGGGGGGGVVDRGERRE
jgi:hypothetical protein